MKIRTYIFAISFFITLFNRCYSDDKFNFNFDYASFKTGNAELYLEFYYEFNQEGLKFVKEGDGYKAGGKILLDIFSQAAGKNIIMKEFNIPINVKDTSLYDKNSKLTGQINFLLDPGSYKIKVRACDLNESSRCVDAAEDINLEPIPSDLVCMSYIELATNILKSSDEKNIFYKNTLEVTPNPSKLFGNNLSQLFYYAELYNLRADLISDNYTVDILVDDGEGNEVKRDSRQYTRKGDSKVEYGAIDIADVPSGKYTLIVKVSNDKNVELSKTSKVFYIFNSNVVVESGNLTDIDRKYFASLYPNMDEKKVEDEFHKSIYIMAEKNREQYAKLTDIDSRRKFMFLFWDAYDPNPATPDSEFRKDYLDRVDFANKYFGSDFKQGWRTDRGRVYCIYGKYDEIERHAYESTTRAYEIWGYARIQGGVQFVFVDESAGYGDFLLVHSNAQHEIYNENWREKLSIK